MEERSLDEFVETTENGSDSDGDKQTTAGPDDDSRASPGADGPDRVHPESVEPAAVTSRVVPGGTACEGCGEEVSRLWTGEDGERCRDCKEW